MPPMNVPGAYSVDDVRSQAIVDVARLFVGLSPQVNWEEQQAVLNPHDTHSDQKGYAFGYPNLDPPVPPQSSCMQVLMAAARDAGKDGTIPWEGFTVDVLRVPQAGIPGVSPRLVGDSPRIVRALGEHHGLLQLPSSSDPRDGLRPGTAAMIGGDDGLPPAQRTRGGLTHGVLIEAVRDDGTYDIIEGGQGAGGTIARSHCELIMKRPGSWWLHRIGSPGQGRELQWWFDMGALPDQPV